MGDKLGDKSKTRREADTASQTTDKSIARPETSWETRERQAGRRPETRARQDQGGGHSIPDRRQVGRQEQRQEKDETREADAAPQPRWETRPETRARRDQGGGHSIPDQRQVGRQDRSQEKDKTREGDAAPQPKY